MTKYSKLLILSLSLLMNMPATAGEVVAGRLFLLENCPGDKGAAGTKQVEMLPFLAAILTPLLSGVVNQGLKAAGTKLSATASEANVDVLHVGDHFYLWPGTTDIDNSEAVWNKEPRLNHSCIIVASKGTLKQSRGASQNSL